MAGIIFPAISLLCNRKDQGRWQLSVKEAQKRTDVRNSSLGSVQITTSGLDSPHLVPVCRGNVIVFCPEVGCSNNEIHMEVAVIILLKNRKSGSDEVVSWSKDQVPSTANYLLVSPRHRGTAENICSFRPSWKSLQDDLHKGLGLPPDPQKPILYSPSVLAHPSALPRVPSLSTFSKSIGYILNPGSLSGLGSVALSSSRRLSSVQREGHRQLFTSRDSLRWK
jgi:hypothetical protein